MFRRSITVFCVVASRVPVGEEGTEKGSSPSSSSLVAAEVAGSQIKAPSAAETADDSIQAVKNWRADFQVWKNEEQERDAAEKKKMRGYDRFNIRAQDNLDEIEGERFLSSDEVPEGGTEVQVTPAKEIVEERYYPEGDDGSATVRGDVVPQGAPGENLKWVQRVRDDRKIGDDGKFIVNHTQHPTGELAYRTPPEPTHVDAARFGYTVIQTYHHRTYWENWRDRGGLNAAGWHVRWALHMCIFVITISWVGTYLVAEARRIKASKFDKAVHKSGEVLGRGSSKPIQTKTKYTEEEEKDRLVRRQIGFEEGHGMDPNEYIGNKDYAMKRIPRPKEFNYESSLAELGVGQPNFTKIAQRKTTPDDKKGHSFQTTRVSAGEV